MNQKIDYTRLTKAELIERLQELEHKSDHDLAALSSRSAVHQLAESALRDSEERIRAILENAVEGIVTIDDRGIIESLNPAAQRMFGYDPKELIGRNVSVLMPEPYRSQHDTYIANYLRSGHAKIIGIGREVVGQHKDGSVFPMDLSVGEVQLAEGRLFTGIVRDITERKNAESRLAELATSLAEKNKELETVVYVASHDLRSPLVNIQGFSKELAHCCARIQERLASPEFRTLGQDDIGRLLKEDVPEAINFILAGVGKMDSLLSGFLRFSRLGRAALQIRELDMNKILAEIARTMEFQLKQAGVSLRIENLPPCYGDETQINQVFSNLLTNALKYLTPDRPGEIRVQGSSRDRMATYRVIDNGIGIAENHQAKIFEIFHRLNPSASEGEGLGLSIAQRILERHQGKIWVASKEGDGSTFFVSIPQVPFGPGVPFSP